MSSATGRGDKQREPPLFQRIADDVARLAAEGVSRNRIADQLDVAPATVTKAARHAGIDLDTAPADAVAGRVRQAEQARLELAGLAHRIAMTAGEKLVDALDRDDLEAVRPLAVAFGVAADKEISLARVLPDDNRDEHEAAELWLEGLRMQIHAANEGLIRPDANGNTPISFGPDDHNPNPNPLEEL